MLGIYFAAHTFLFNNFNNPHYAEFRKKQLLKMDEWMNSNHLFTRHYYIESGLVVFIYLSGVRLSAVE